MISVKKLILEKDPEFYKNLDPNLKLFASEIRRELREEGHVVIGITGYPGYGKSNDAAVFGTLVDEDYNFEDNVCYIPTSSQIEETYMGLRMFSYLHIDEASRGLHKHKWHDKVQQKLNELYDTEREGHFLCTALLMPRFQNFTENFRNFMIKYWVHIPCKGLAIFYKRDEDKDAKDPWHIDENYKMKQKKYRGKRVFERSLPEQVRAEQVTDCYWFYCKIPAIPKEVWQIYQEAKKNSRVKAKEMNVEMESYKDRLQREKIDRWNKIRTMKMEGKCHADIGAALGISAETIRRNLREIEAYDKMKGGTSTPTQSTMSDSILIYNPIRDDKNKKIPEEFNNI